MKILRGLLLAACLIFAAPHADARNKKHEAAAKATFVLYGRSEKEGIAHHALCTAFVYKKASDGYYLLTAGHCFVNTSAPEDVTYAVAEGQIVDEPVLQPVELLNAVDDGKMDVAELHLKTTKQYPVLEFEKKPVKIEDKIFYVGYPEMVSQVILTGRVDSNLMQSEGEHREPCDICKGRFLVQTGGGPGASGSPVLNEHTGRVVGILEGHLFENGVVVVPAPAIESYYVKQGHSKAELKNVQSEEKT
jgi:V8-like Glu-specific endopeptidase